MLPPRVTEDAGRIWENPSCDSGAFQVMLHQPGNIRIVFYDKNRPLHTRILAADVSRTCRKRPFLGPSIVKN